MELPDGSASRASFRPCSLAGCDSPRKVVASQTRNFCEVHQREYMRRYNQAYVKANRERLAEANKRRHIERFYGLSAEAYDALVADQGGLCAICRKPEKALTRGWKVHSLHVDHDHLTGKRRALLCAKCNMAVGVFENHQYEISAYVARYS